MDTGAELIFISSKDRLETIEKTLPKWLDFEVEKRYGLAVIVEPQERYAYKDLVRTISPDIEVITLRKKNQGIGYSRNMAFKTAWRLGLRSFITADDDMYPRDDPAILLKAARTKKVFGIGAMFGLYGFYLGVEPYTGQYMTSGRVGFSCFAMNTANVHAVGGFDEFFVGGGHDDEGMALKGIVELGIPWRVHTDFNGTHIGKKNAPGGFQTWIKTQRGKTRPKMRHDWHKLAYHRYPEWVSDPKRCRGKAKCQLRYQWRKMMNECCGIDIPKTLAV